MGRRKSLGRRGIDWIVMECNETDYFAMKQLKVDSWQMPLGSHWKAAEIQWITWPGGALQPRFLARISMSSPSRIGAPASNCYRCLFC